MKNIQISLPGHSYQYQVQIGSNILKKGLKELLMHQVERKVFIVTNDLVNELYPTCIEDALPEGISSVKLILPDGEVHKNLESYSKILDFLIDEEANRKSILIAFGGGVIGDMTGFAAASYMRGIPYIQVPSTLLSQVDSSVGGKTAVNHTKGKNVIGAFKQPLGTLIDIDLLSTLPRREFVAGYGELIKHGFISDAYLYQLLNSHPIDELRGNKSLLIDAVSRSCQVKATVVEQDEREAFQRALLNFGHTIGHMIETATGYSQYLHGEAILAGMDFAAFWSKKQGLLDDRDFQAVHKHLVATEVVINLEALDEQTFMSLVGHDKKSSNQGVNFVALHSIGQASIVEKVPIAKLWISFLSYLELDDALIHVKG